MRNLTLDEELYNGQGRSGYSKRTYSLPPEVIILIEETAMTTGEDRSLIVLRALHYYFTRDIGKESPKSPQRNTIQS